MHSRAVVEKAEARGCCSAVAILHAASYLAETLRQYSDAASGREMLLEHFNDIKFCTSVEQSFGVYEFDQIRREF